MILQETSISLTPTETKAVLSLLGIAVAMALWALKVVVRAFIEMRDQGRDIKHAVFGDPKASPKNGLIRTLDAHGTSLRELSETFTEHVAKEMAWQEHTSTTLNTKHNEFHRLLNDIESRLPQKPKRPRSA